jgi:hypothetical protein
MINGADKNQTSQSYFPPTDYDKLRRDTTKNGTEDVNGHSNREDENLQAADDQDEELEFVQETPINRGSFHQDMCQ